MSHIMVDGWRNININISKEVIHRAKKNWRDFVSKLDPYPNTYSGKGIVFCVGGLTYFTCAIVSISVLRKKGCELPIEIWHSGNELSEDMIAQFLDLGVDVRDIDEYIDQIGSGFIIKPYAILFSKFQEVLFIDSDNVCVADPAYLFNDVSYHAYGTIFWPDFWKTSESNAIWEIMDVPYSPEPEQESGQILINKKVCWKELHLCCHLNQMGRFYYNLLYGDKDTFKFAWLALRRAYYMIDTPVATCGTYNDVDGLFYGNTMVQHDPEGNILFLHRNLMKWDITPNGQEYWNVIKAFNKDGLENNVSLRRINADIQAIDISGNVSITDFKSKFPTLEAFCLNALQKIRLSSVYGISNQPNK